MWVLKLGRNLLWTRRKARGISQFEKTTQKRLHKSQPIISFEKDYRCKHKEKSN